MSTARWVRTGRWVSSAGPWAPALALLLLLGVSVPAGAQENASGSRSAWQDAASSQDTTARALAAVPPALEQAVERVARLEMETLRGARDTAAARTRKDSLADARTALAQLLDRFVVAADSGPAVLATLRSRYPGATILDRYAADLALRDGRPEEAADRYRRLVAMHPTDPALHLGLARAYEAMGRTDRARVAYRRAFDLAPGSEPAFRALVGLARDSAALETLLRQVRRLRTLTGNDALVDHEVELLHRLGRPDEARRVRDAVPDSGAIPDSGGIGAGAHPRGGPE